MFRQIFSPVILLLAVLSATIAQAENSALLRCAAAMDINASVQGKLLRQVITELNDEEVKAFSAYLDMIFDDVAQDRNHIRELSKEEKQRIFSELLEKGNPWDLALSFVGHRRIVASLNITAPTTTRPGIDRFERRVNEYARAFERNQPDPDEVLPLFPENNGPENKAGNQNLSRNVQLQKRDTPLNSKKNIIYRNASDEQLIRIIGDILDPKGGGDKSRMAALLIARIEALLTSGSSGEIANLSVHPESPNLLTRGRVLREAFMTVEEARYDYDLAHAKLEFLQTILKLEGIDPNHLGIGALIAETNQELQSSRERAAPDLDVYLSIKAYLELVINNRNCTVQCRVSALQTLSHLGQFDIYTPPTSRGSLPRTLLTELRKLPPEARENVKKALDKYRAQTTGHRFYPSSEIEAWKNNDQILFNLVNRKTLKRRIWSTISMAYTSNAVAKILESLYRMAKLDKKLWTNFIFQNARDRNELLHSVGTLILISRSNLPLRARLANIEALAAVHPQALVTLHRHSLFRGILAEIKSIREKFGTKAGDENESLKTQFELLFKQIDEASKHPDASRILNLQYDQPTITKAFHFVANVLAITIVSVNMVSPEFASQFHANIHDYLPTAIKELIDGVEDPVRGVMEKEPEIFDDLRRRVNDPSVN